MIAGTMTNYGKVVYSHNYKSVVINNSDEMVIVDTCKLVRPLHVELTGELISNSYICRSDMAEVQELILDCLRDKFPEVLAND